MDTTCKFIAIWTPHFLFFILQDQPASDNPKEKRRATQQKPDSRRKKLAPEGASSLVLPVVFPFPADQQHSRQQDQRHAADGIHQRTGSSGCRQFNAGRFRVDNGDDNYRFHVEVFMNGKTTIDVDPRGRDAISYSGMIHSLDILQ